VRGPFQFNFYVSRVGTCVRGAFAYALSCGCVAVRNCVLASRGWYFARAGARNGANDPRAIHFPNSLPFFSWRATCALIFQTTRTFSPRRVGTPGLANWHKRAWLAGRRWVQEAGGACVHWIAFSVFWTVEEKTVS